MNRKPIFDAVRKMLGGHFTQDQVDALDDACDLAEASLRAQEEGPPIANGAKHSLGKKGIDLIKSFEGCEKDLPDGRFAAYPDPGSVDGHPWTIGWGSTGDDIRKGTIFTAAECDARFEKDMQKYVDQVSRAIGDAPTSQDQFDALVSFHYNTGAIGTATLTREHVAGRFDSAKAQFARWIRNDGKVMRGLVRRRAAEAKLYAGG